MRTCEGFERDTLNPYVLAATDVRDGDCTGYKIMMTFDDPPKIFRAYMGGTAWSDERVLAEGDAISEDAVMALFPVLYRGMVSLGWTYYT